MGVAIALVGASRAFYSWNDNRRLYRMQYLTVTLIIRNWELDLLALVNDAKGNTTEAHEATRLAVEAIGAALEHEQDVFFGSVRPPQLKTPSVPPRSAV